MKLTFGRLAPKLLPLMLLMAGVPLLVAWGLSARLFDRSLGAGLNPEIGQALSDAVEVFGERIRAEKAHHRAVAAGLADGAPAVRPAHGRPRDRRPPARSRAGDARVRRFQRMEADVIAPFNTPEADRERRASLYAWSFVGTLAAAILGAGAIALVAGGRVTRRIYRLQRAMTRVAAGRFDTRVVVSGHDEVTELMTGFNRMTDQVQEGRARIEYRTQISAWQGIARRMAHEIKNPLTPILLSAKPAESAWRGDDASTGARWAPCA